MHFKIYIKFYKIIYTFSQMGRLFSISLRVFYTVQKIVGKRFKGGTKEEYKVKWKNYPNSQNTWQPKENLENVQGMIRDFEDRNQDGLITLNLYKKRKDMISIRNSSVNKNSLQRPNSERIEEMKTTRRHSDRIGKRGQPQSHRDSQITEFSQNEESEKETQQEVKPKHKKQSQKTGSIQNECLEQQILGSSLDNIASKIMVAVKEKNKSFQIVSIQKRGPNQEDLYQIEDDQGKKEWKTREYVLRNLPLQLISYYEKFISFKPTFE